MQVLELVAGLFYVVVGAVLFIGWLESFRHDQDDLTQQEQRVSMFVLAIASVFWIIALPFAYLELLDRFKNTSRATRLYQSMLENPQSPSVSANDEIRYFNR